MSNPCWLIPLRRWVEETKLLPEAPWTKSGWDMVIDLSGEGDVSNPKPSFLGVMTHILTAQNIHISWALGVQR